MSLIFTYYSNVFIDLEGFSDLENVTCGYNGTLEIFFQIRSIQRNGTCKLWYKKSFKLFQLLYNHPIF